MPRKTISLQTDADEHLKATRRITLPPPKATARELLADMKSGRFGRGVDWKAVKRAVARRRRSRELRPA